MDAQSAILLFNILIPFLLTAVIAQVVRDLTYPVMKEPLLVTGEATPARKSILSHIADCGLLYPAVFVYLVAGFDWLAK
ncbi:hypothetical protein D3C76_112750 [compost metagenome]